MRRRTKQRLIRGILYLILAIAVAIAAVVADWDAIIRNFLQLDIARAMFPKVLSIAAKNTVVYTLIAFVGGLGLGLLLALMKLSPVAPYRWIATTYIEL